MDGKEEWGLQEAMVVSARVPLPSNQSHLICFLICKMRTPSRTYLKTLLQIKYNGVVELNEASSTCWELKT